MAGPWSSKENSSDAEDYAERIGDRCGSAPVLTPGKRSEVIFGEFAEAEESRGDGTGNAEARDYPRKAKAHDDELDCGQSGVRSLKLTVVTLLAVAELHIVLGHGSCDPELLHFGK